MPIEWVPLSEERKKWLSTGFTQAKNPRKFDPDCLVLKKKRELCDEALRRCPIPEWLLNRELPAGTASCPHPQDEGE